MSTSVTALKNIGAKTAQHLARLGIYTVEDLLFHLPTRYEDQTQITSIATLQTGKLALIEGRIYGTEIKTGKKNVLLCRFSDGSGEMILRFFNFYPQQLQKFNQGLVMRCFGEVRNGQYSLEMVHPNYEFVAEDSKLLRNYLTPIYPNVNPLTRDFWHTAIEQALQYPIQDLLPEQLYQKLNLPPLTQALQTIHRPNPPEPNTITARKRLAFEELLAHSLSVNYLRHNIQHGVAPDLSTTDDNLWQKFMHQLPFALTAAQQRVIREIQQDLQKTKPMQRLLQGDVGCGKTVVAALTALQAIAAGYQVAIMAPTELLAEQHKNTFSQWFSPLNLPIAWLTSSLTAKQKRQTLENIQLNLSRLIVGTHALFQSQVKFANLGLIIIDEQHKFGVHQRLALRDKGKYPHQLIMTATPIPRTLAMTAYADLEVSVIDELPPGRTAVQTAVMCDTKRPEIVQRIKELCQSGKQAYWVCPLIEDSETLQLQAAENTLQELRQLLPELQLGLVHGRMAAKHKEQVMQQFKSGELDLLVATTVIEVGVDVPNASIMLIENAERLGLAQLHQLRGRVGRGSELSYCILLYQPPLSALAKNRLQIMREHNDGFVIAQKDLELRGPGELLGTRQKGLLNLKIANLNTDADLCQYIPNAAQWMLDNYPQHVSALIQRWVNKSPNHDNFTV